MDRVDQMTEQKIEMIATRDAYGEALKELAAKDKNIIALDADLALSTKSITVKEVDPNRFHYVGICEQNMVGMSVGLTLEGKKVFASTFAIFLTRAIEIIRQSVCYAQVPVKLVGSHAGLLTGQDGATAQCLEDISYFRTLPFMNVIVPCDGIETREATKFLAEFKEASYLRTNREKTPTVNNADYEFELGKGVQLHEGSDATIIATGGLVYIALNAAKLLEQEKISCRVINIHSIKPIDEKIILKAAKETNALITAEDHQIIGGLGSAVSEVLAENSCSIPFKRIGMQNRFGESGKPLELYTKYGFTAENLSTQIKNLLK